MWLKLMSALVKIYFLLTESESRPALERDNVHAENLGVEIGCGMDVLYGKDDVVQLLKSEGHCCIMRLSNGR